FLFFFFQAEDGIRDFHVTGVQTCALPIWQRRPREYLLADLVFQLGSLHLAVGPAAVVAAVAMVLAVGRPIAAALPLVALLALYRSEERRVGNGWRAQWRRERAKRKSDTDT